MEGFSRIIDSELWLHKEAAAITSTQDGSVATVATTHLTGPGAFGHGTELVINVTSADFTTGDETYTVDFQGQKAGGGWVSLGLFEIIGAEAGQWKIPVTNLRFGITYDEIKVVLTLAGTTPILDATVRLTTTLI